MRISQLKISLLSATLLFAAGAWAQNAPGTRVYIAIGDPNVKKSLIAVENTKGGGRADEYYQTLMNDLDFTDLFEFLPGAKYPSPLGGMDIGSFSFDAYRAQGVAFLVKTSMSVVNGTTQVELRLFDVIRGVQILGRIYPFVSKDGNPARELAHYSGNDILQTLTGESGVFRTRILASCGKRKKEIYIMDFDGSNIKPLTRDNNLALSPSWAPDGKKFLFTSYVPAVRGGFVNPNLYLYDLATKKRKVLSAAKGLNTGGSFHPNGHLVAYTFSQNGKPEIYVLDLNQNTRKPITKTQFFSVEPSYSNDGSLLTYSSSKTGRPHIYVSDANGGNARRLTFAGVYNSSPHFTPKGDKIVFAGQESMGNNFNVFMVDTSGSNLVRLTDGSHSSENPSFSPDGRHIVFASNQSGNYRIYVMTAFGTRIRAISPPELGDCKQPTWSPRL
jgi:TolB protein